MTYKEELKVMSNEELLSDLRFNTEYKLYKKRKDVETELLARNPMSENCGNCKWPYKYYVEEVIKMIDDFV